MTPRVLRFVLATIVHSQYIVTSDCMLLIVPRPVFTIRYEYASVGRNSRHPQVLRSGVKRENMNDFGMSGDDLEQMSRRSSSRHPNIRTAEESFAPDAASEQSGEAAANITVRASHEYCTPANRTSSTPPAAMRQPSMLRFPTTSRTPSSDWSGTAMAAPSHKPVCP